MVPTPRLARRSLPLLALALVAAAGCRPALRPEVLEAVRRGTGDIDRPAAIDVPMVGGPTLPMVDVLINGKGPYPFLIDLGGNVVSIRDEVAQEAGLETIQALSSRRVVRGDVRVGGTTFRKVAIVAEPVLDVAGVLGFNLFREGLVTLDYPAQRFVWARGTLPPAGSQGVAPYQLRERMPYVEARFGAETAWANLDTGARLALIVPARREGRLPTRGPVTARVMWNQAEGQIRSREATLDGDLSIAGTVVARAPRVTFSPALEDEVLIGSAALREVRLTLDTAQRRFRIERTAPPAAQP